MKKFFAIAAIAAMTLGFLACEPEEEQTPNPGPGTEQGGENNGGENNGGENNGGDQGETPAPAPVEFACLNGSDYYVIVLVIVRSFHLISTLALTADAVLCQLFLRRRVNRVTYPVPYFF